MAVTDNFAHLSCQMIVSTHQEILATASLNVTRGTIILQTKPKQIMLMKHLCHKVIGKEGFGEVVPNQNDVLYVQTIKH